MVRRNATRLAALPWATLGLLALFAILHFWVAGLAGGQERRAVFYLLLGGVKIDALVSGGDWWRLLSCIFLHGTFSHLAVNAVGVLVLGWYLENSVGWFAPLAIFVVSGFLGSLASFVLVDTPSMGASGGMFGLIGASVVLVAFNWTAIPWYVKTYVVGFPAAVGLFSLGHDLFEGNLDTAAHAGGIVSGASAVVLWRLSLRMERGPTLSFAFFLAKTLLALAAAFCLAVTSSHLLLRFDLPAPRLGVASMESGEKYNFPKGWTRGTFYQGECLPLEDGALLDESRANPCYVDSFLAWYIVAPSDRILNSAVFAEYLQRKAGGVPDNYGNHEIFLSTDRERGFTFALLAFDGISDKYLPIFAALRTEPVRQAP